MKGIEITFGLVKEDDKPFQVPIAEDSYETYQFDPPPYSLETTKNELRKLYEDMTVIRLDKETQDSLIPDANQWQTNGTRGRWSIQRKENQRLLSLINWTGSSRCWNRAWDHQTRQTYYGVSVPWLHPDARRHDQVYSRRASWAARRHLIWQGRFYAYVL